MSVFQRWRQGWERGKAALIVDEATLDYAALDDRVGRAASWWLARGLTAGDIVALQLRRSPLFLELHLALLALGAATLPLNEQYTPTEVEQLCRDAGARWVVIDDDAPDLDLPLLRRAEIRFDDHPVASLPAAWPPSTLAVLIYTSGTTGRPKGARITQGQLEAGIDALHAAWRWRADDVLLHALPLFHIHGLFVAQLGALRAGATTVWMSRFDADQALLAIERHRVTIFMGVPTYYHRLLSTRPAPDLSTMRLFTSGSAPLPAHEHRAFEQRFGFSIVERYGMTEVGIVLSNPIDGPRKPGSVGLPLPGVELRITDAKGHDVKPGDVGELRVAAPSVFDGYHGLPEATAAAIGDGWMRTGDLGRVDDDGYVFLVGRQTDLILRGGMNVYPPEVEAALLDVPGVSEAAVVGLPDPDLGERVAAFIVGDPDDQALQRGLAVLAPFKRPREIHRVAQLPRNTMGKVQKNLLRAWKGGVEVRPANQDDLDALVEGNLRLALETEGLALDEAVVRRGVQVGVESALSRYWVATRDGAVVGQVMTTIEWSDWRAASVWWLQSVYVWPPHRRAGVFGALYAEVQREAEAAGAAGLRLYVDQRNETAMAVYRRLGMNGDHYRVFERMLGGRA